MRATFIVRTVGNNVLALAGDLRREIVRARPDFYVSNLRTQNELIQSHTVRERLLAILASFFETVALLLAGVGLYGILGILVGFGLGMAAVRNIESLLFGVKATDVWTLAIPGITILMLAI